MLSTVRHLGQIEGVLLYQKEPRSSQRYTPKYREDNVLETKAQKEPMRSMGPLKVPRSSPQNYLRKERKRPKAPKGERHICEERKPLVPDSRNKLQLLRKKIDYVATAIAEQRVTDRPKAQAVADSHTGHKYFPENSGLFPQHVNKKDYGKVPAYVRQRTSEERNKLEGSCIQLQEQKEDTIQKRLQKQRDALLGLRRIWYQIAGESGRIPMMMESALIRSCQQRLDDKLLCVDSNIECAQKCLERMK